MAKGAAVVLAILAVPFTTAVAPPPSQGLQWQQCAKIAEGWANGEASDRGDQAPPLAIRCSMPRPTGVPSMVFSVARNRAALWRA